jgi:hypothetical protein
MYAQLQPGRTVLGYSTDGKVYHSVPVLQGAVLPPGTAVGWYVDTDNLTHVLTRTPFEVALFKQGAWGDPTYSAPTGQLLAKQSTFRALPHPADHSLLLLTRLAVQGQARVSGSVTGPKGVTIPVLGKGSRFGSPLKAGTFRLVQSYRRKPGSMQVQLRVNARGLQPGPYNVHVVALDPWGRRSHLNLRFRYR